LADKGSLLVILITGINYAINAALQTFIDAHCVGLYGLPALRAGLIYFPSGIGGSTGEHGAGRRFRFKFRCVHADGIRNE